MTSIVWFRNDLRLEDHPALEYAVKNSKSIVPIFIQSTENEEWTCGAASKWWLHHSLADLKERLHNEGLSLIIRQGSPEKILVDIIQETGAGLLVWNRLYEPEAIKRDTRIKSVLTEKGVTVKSFPGNVLMEPWESCTKEGKPYRVFTPFWKNMLRNYRHELPKKCLKKGFGFEKLISTLSVDDLELLPVIPWDREFSNVWKPGSYHALKKSDYFITHGMNSYKELRDFPYRDGVSFLSPHLHFGEITPRMIWDKALSYGTLQEEGVETFLRQLGWREFAFHLLYHFPRTTNIPLNPRFEEFPWKNDPSALSKWQKGYTGYPIIDAGMRQLWRTGWMHNRVRMLVGSFLVKDLRISWLEGARWFWDTLVDADLANNTLGWQWVGGCGADAAPYFRVFNPVLQSEKFDCEGEYIRQWVPELAGLSSKWIHKPWMAGKEELARAGVVLGKNYPFPMVDHDVARLESLNAFKNS